MPRNLFLLWLNNIYLQLLYYNRVTSSLCIACLSRTWTNFRVFLTFSFLTAEPGSCIGDESSNLLGLFFYIIFTRSQVARVNIPFLLYFAFENQKCCKLTFLFFINGMQEAPTSVLTYVNNCFLTNNCQERKKLFPFFVLGIRI